MWLSLSSEFFIVLLLLFGTISRTKEAAISDAMNNTDDLMTNVNVPQILENIDTDDTALSGQRFPKVDLVAKLIEIIERNRAGFMQLSSVIAESSKQLSSINDQSKRLVSAVERLDPCPVSWFQFGGLCLLYDKELKTWRKAERFCESKGGFLVWFESKAEHLLINGFLQRYPPVRIFHIGLFRPTRGAPLEWTSGSKSPYRGNLRQVPGGGNYFEANKNNGLVFGYGKKHKAIWPVLCRRL